MSYYSYPVILALLVAASGCSSLSRKTGIVYTPVEVPVVVEKYIRLPAGLLAKCPVTHGKDRTVKEYVRVANTNTPALVACAKQIEEISKLQPTGD